MFDIRNHGGIFGGGTSKTKDYEIKNTNIYRFGDSTGFQDNEFIRSDSTQGFNNISTSSYIVGDDGTYVWFLNQTERTLMKVNPITRTIVTTYTLIPGVATSFTPDFVYMDFTRNKVYGLMLNGNFHYPFVYDLTTSTGFVSNTLSINSTARVTAHVADNKLIYVGGTGIWIIDNVDSITANTPVTTTLTTEGFTSFYQRYMPDTNTLLFASTKNVGGLAFLYSLNLTTKTLSAGIQVSVDNVTINNNSLYISEDGSYVIYSTNQTSAMAYKRKIANGILTTVNSWVIPTSYGNIVNVGNTRCATRSAIKILPRHGLTFFAQRGIYKLNDDSTLDIIYNNNYGGTAMINMSDSEYIPSIDAIFNCSYSIAVNQTWLGTTWLVDAFKFK